MIIRMAIALATLAGLLVAMCGVLIVVTVFAIHVAVVAAVSVLAMFG